jgi:hypothetical protein
VLLATATKPNVGNQYPDSREIAQSWSPRMGKEDNAIENHLKSLWK